MNIQGLATFEEASIEQLSWSTMNGNNVHNGRLLGRLWEGIVLC